MNRLIIFDFDGVVADSEIIASTALAEALTEIGLTTTLEDVMEHYMGRHWVDNVAVIEAKLGGPLPEGWAEGRRARVREQVAVRLTEVRGLSAFLDAHEDWPRCIASSSTHEWIGLCLDRLGLAARFEHRFSGAEDVAEGKPAPDLFLHAARTCGVAPADCIVIEDSVAGIRGGVAAGMYVIGLTAGSHTRPGHREALLAAGADAVVASYAEVAALLADQSRSGAPSGK